MEDDLLLDNRPEAHYTAEQAKTKNEMRRMANDRILVYNPTDEDFTVLWDAAEAGGAWIVPNKNKDTGAGAGCRVVPRYIAVNYVNHMVNKIIGNKVVKAIVDENARRTAVPGGQKMNLYEEQWKFEESQLREYRTEKMQLYPILYRGVVEYYAPDKPLEMLETPRQKPLDEVLQRLDRPAQAPTPQVIEPLASVEAKKEQLAQEVGV